MWIIKQGYSLHVILTMENVTTSRAFYYKDLILEEYRIEFI